MTCETRNRLCEKTTSQPGPSNLPLSCCVPRNVALHSKASERSALPDNLPLGLRPTFARGKRRANASLPNFSPFSLFSEPNALEEAPKPLRGEHTHCHAMQCNAYQNHRNTAPTRRSSATHPCIESGSPSNCAHAYAIRGRARPVPQRQ